LNQASGGKHEFHQTEKNCGPRRNSLFTALFHRAPGERRQVINPQGVQTSTGLPAEDDLQRSFSNKVKEDYMRKIIDRPGLFLLMIFFISLLISNIFPSSAPVFDLWILFLGLLISIFWHELGHTIFGVSAGLRFHFLAFGPFFIEKAQGKVKIRENKHWMYFGGVSFLTPAPHGFSKIKAKWGLYLFGGPFFSLIAFFGFFMIWKTAENDRMLWYAILNMAIFIATSFPIPKGEANDGGNLFLLFRDKDQTYLLKIQVLSEMFGSKRPMDWDKGLIEQCKEIMKEKNALENPMINTFLFYHYFDAGKMEQILSILEPIVHGPPLRDKKWIKGSFNSLYILCKFLYENNEDSLEEFEKLFKEIPRFDSYAYHRSLAIIKFLKGDVEGAKNLISQLERELDHTDGQGMYHTEKEILQKLRGKMLI
jgi:hypothetical protein